MVRRRAIATLSCAKVIGGKNAADERNHSDSEATAVTETIDIPPAVPRIRNRLRKAQMRDGHARFMGRGGAHCVRISHKGLHRATEWRSLSDKYNTKNCHNNMTVLGESAMQDPLLDCEQDIREHLAEHITQQCPPLLGQAMEYAVFPGGARVRPQLCMAVALANNSSDRALAAAAATAVEFLHCASLVHDDLPCFDDATQRRGKPSLHAKFGERIAVLTGDALIVAAFQTLAVHAIHHVRAERVPLVLSILARGVGAPHGIAAGQAWECEPAVDVSRYHRAKTGALFIAATCAGAASAGVDPGPWVNLGACIGEAFQVADDIKDAVGNPEILGKAVGIDAKLGRPSAVGELGLDGATARLKNLLEEGLDSVPHCSGRDSLVKLVRAQSSRFVPEKLGRTAA